MRAIFFLILLTVFSSCARDMTKYGKVHIYKSGSSKAFSFKIEEEFVRLSQSADQDEIHSLMNEDEVDLLSDLLVKEKLCLDKYNYPRFIITSRQQKIYDVTFANLIEQNYNAKPISPLTYYGRCS